MRSSEVTSVGGADGGRRAHDERRNVSDAAGVVVLGACATWSLVTGTLNEGRPEGVLLAVLAVAAGYAAGRMGGALLPVAAPCAGALAGPALVVAVPGLAAGPRFAAPLGHAGATAGLLALSVGAACCAAWAASAPALRIALRALAVAIVLTAAVLGSSSGVVCCTVVLLCSLAAGRMRRRGPGIAGLALVAAAVTGTSWALAARILPDGLTESLEGWLTPRRVELWRDALRLAHRNAGLGAGPDRFGEFSPTAAQALQPDGKPHSALFQQAAEQGLIGVGLLALAYGWMLYALLRTARPTPLALTAGAALTALAVIATVGDALSFTAVSVGAGLLAGMATAHPLADEAGATVTRERPGRDRMTP
ncbi:O-antigen ligase family protein [Streptomyces carpinensis]|uniref:O-antigen ligase family protein n=1 Tax=Streptomyces carpinensis TaxID=66369 RepID=UPI001FC95270|nr:O-antigen ligase family protein [Streptomyces carpinensis]